MPKTTGQFGTGIFMPGLNQPIMADLKNYKIIVATAWTVVVVSILIIFIKIIP
jgi:hypothetical protein